MTVCPELQIDGNLEPPLSDAEKRLVCGDPKPIAPGSTAWKRIPPAQARFHLRAFLQARGYLHPRFVERGNGNILQPGAATLAASLRAPGAPPVLHLERRRKVVGEKLTPDLLSSVEKWTFQRLQGSGFPCPDVKATADPDSGAITLQVSSGARKNFGEVINDDVYGMEPGVLRRYDAFRPGWEYDGDSLNLTENRVVSLGIVQSLHFETQCGLSRIEPPEAVSVRERIVAGPSRLVSVGFGLNTEGAVVVRGSWSNNRLGPKASQINASLYGSSRRQRLELLGHYYFLPGAARFHLRPLIQYEHQSEIYYETLSFRANATPSTSMEARRWGATFNFGPTWEVIRTLRGPGLGDSHFTSLMGEMIYRTHDFEYYATSPRSGANVTARVALSDKDVFSTTSAQRLSMSSEMLWNLKDYDPSLLVFGLRGGALSTLGPERTGPGTLLPAEFLYYLGGSQNMRGYGRQELPDPDGALTALYLNFEVRLTHELPLGIEPVVFWDMGWLGKDPLNVDFPAFHSPGVGVRWNSPVGIFRATAAHGITSTNTVNAHWQFYLSYGEEF